VSYMTRVRRVGYSCSVHFTLLLCHSRVRCRSCSHQNRGQVQIK